jgi:hypothetical protein
MSEKTEEPAAEDGVGIDEVLASNETRSTPGLIGEETDGRRPSALDGHHANVLAMRTRPTVLVLAGGVDCGKTSVYAAIYERLGRGEFAGRMFAGSYTIPGFEERCHYWREGSDRTASWSKHTQGGDLPWLHLRLRDEALERGPLELLLGDFDGEFFDALINNETQPHELPFLRRADHVGVVLDGHKLADAASRPAQRESVLYLVDQLYKEPDSAPPSALLVVTKVDLIDQTAEAGQQQAISEVIDEVHTQLAARGGGDVPVVRLAVRSESPRFPLGHGLEDLLELLTVRQATHLSSAPPPVAAVTTLASFQA